MLRVLRVEVREMTRWSLQVAIERWHPLPGNASPLRELEKLTDLSLIKLIDARRVGSIREKERPKQQRF